MTRWRAALPMVLVLPPLLWLVAVPLLVSVVVAFRPTGFLLDPGFTLDNLRQTWGDPRLWTLTGNTLRFALGSSVLALVLGTGLAWVTERSDMRHARLVRMLLLLPMALPPFLMAMAWTLLASPRTGALNLILGLHRPVFDIYSMGGMVMVEGLSLTPSAFLVVAPALRRIDATLEEAALTMGGGSRMVRRVVLPLLAPALLGAVTYLLIVSVMVFDVPGTIGMPAGIELLSTHMYDLVNNSPTGLPDYGAMGAIALLLVVVLGALCLAHQGLLSRSARFVTVTGRPSRPRTMKLGRMRVAALLFVGLYLLLAVVLPVTTLVWTSLLPYPMPPGAAALDRLTLANHAGFFADPRIGVASWHSLAVALAAGSGATALGFLTSWVAIRSNAPGRRLVDLLAFLPLALPGVLIGTALTYVYLATPGLRLYGSIWIIAVAHLTVYLAFATRALNAALAQIAPELEAASALSGAARARTLRRITGPLVAPALGGVWVWVFAHSLRELSAALMLQGSANATLPVLLFGYWSEGQPTRSAAAGVWLVVVLLVLLGLGNATGRRR